MTANSTAKVNGRSRSKASSKPSPESANETAEVQAAGADPTEEATNSEASKGENMADNVVKITARPVQGEGSGQKDGAIQLHQGSLMVWNRPVMPSDFEIAETINDGGIRPIAASNMEVYASYLNGRPIMASHLKVAEMLPGDRPVFASDFNAVEGHLLPGDRPIMASDPALLEASMLPGNRPIASNNIIDPEPAALMGYLD